MAETANSAHDCASTSKSMSGPGDAAAWQSLRSIGEERAPKHNPDPVTAYWRAFDAYEAGAIRTRDYMAAFDAMHAWEPRTATDFVRKFEAAYSLGGSPTEENEARMIAQAAALLGGDRSNTERALNSPAQTPGAPQPPDFAPSAWLAEFDSVGGAYALTEAGLHLCIVPGDRSVEELGKARMLIVGLSSEEKNAIAEELRGRKVMEASHGSH